MKNLYIVCYDVMNPERLHQVYKRMRGFGEHTQYSVFLCRLNPKERVLLNEALLDAINQTEDRVMIVNLGPAEGTSENRIEILGKQEPPKEPAATVV